MDDLCKHCGNCCKFIPVDVKNKLLLRDSIQPLTEDFESFLTPLDSVSIQILNDIYPINVLKSNIQFFKCKYLLNENICSNPQKPDACKNFPSTPFALLPNDCGYIGKQFLKLEDFKQKIRKMKEEILHYEALMIDEPQNKRGYQKIVERLQAYIDKYAVYGSGDW